MVDWLVLPQFLVVVYMMSLLTLSCKQHLILYLRYIPVNSEKQRPWHWFMPLSWWQLWPYTYHVYRFSIRLYCSHECNSILTQWRDVNIGTNIHLDSRTNWLDFGGEGSNHTSIQIPPKECNYIWYKLGLMDELNRICVWTDVNVNCNFTGWWRRTSFHLFQEC